MNSISLSTKKKVIEQTNLFCFSFIYAFKLNEKKRLKNLCFVFAFSYIERSTAVRNENKYKKKNRANKV